MLENDGKVIHADAPYGAPFTGEAARVARQSIVTRSPVAAVLSGYVSPFSIAAGWLFPWTYRSYPGFQKGVLAVLPRAVTWGACKHWRAGRRRIPADIARALANAIRSRCEAGMQIVNDLERYAAIEEETPRRLTGFCAVNEQNGMKTHKRGRGARPFF